VGAREGIVTGDAPARVGLTQDEAEALYEFFERDDVPPHWEEPTPIQRVQQKCREAFTQGPGGPFIGQS
jgi:hypothetical protein